MKKELCVAAFGLAVVVNSATAQKAKSTFDTHLEGWTMVGNGTFSHQSSGGNPGGYARWVDVSGPNGDGWAVAPADYRGSWASLTTYGALKWDHRIVNPGNGTTFLNGRAEISGPGGAAFYQSPVQMNSNWTTFSAPIKQPSWSITSGTWASLVTNVTSLKIRLEAVWGGTVLDQAGIDNVYLGDTNELVVSISVASVDINWMSRTGATYQVQWTSSLTQPAWSNVNGVVTGTGSNMYLNDVIRGVPQRFYRAVENP